MFFPLSVISLIIYNKLGIPSPRCSPQCAVACTVVPPVAPALTEATTDPPVVESFLLFLLLEQSFFFSSSGREFSLFPPVGREISPFSPARTEDSAVPPVEAMCIPPAALDGAVWPQKINTACSTGWLSRNNDRPELQLF